MGAHGKKSKGILESLKLRTCFLIQGLQAGTLAMKISSFEPKKASLQSEECLLFQFLLAFNACLLHFYVAWEDR